MAGSQSALLMAQRLTDGRLAPIVAGYRKAGASWPTAANLLRSEYGVEVTGDTLRVWSQKLDVEALLSPEPETEAAK